MNYGDIIEYIDGTRDLHFEEARRWCKSHNVTFNELMERRNLPNRYFQIGYPPEPHVPTQEEQKQACISELKQFLASTDYISCKLIEAIDEVELQDLKEKYKDVLKQRREARAEINKLEM